MIAIEALTVPPHFLIHVMMSSAPWALLPRHSFTAAKHSTIRHTLCMTAFEFSSLAVLSLVLLCSWVSVLRRPGDAASTGV